LVLVVVVFVVVEFVVVVVPPLFMLAEFMFDVAFVLPAFMFDVLVVVVVFVVVEFVVVDAFVLVRLVLALLVLVPPSPHAIVPATNRARAIAVSVFFIDSSWKAFNTAVCCFRESGVRRSTRHPRPPRKAAREPGRRKGRRPAVSFRTGIGPKSCGRAPVKARRPPGGGRRAVTERKF
jgi:hypothetical protein